jgi:hypothetical protein
MTVLTVLKTTNLASMGRSLTYIPSIWDTAAGAPVQSAGVWNYRQKVGAKGISEHVFGGAIDVNQTGPDEVTPAFRRWIAANPGVL